MEKVMVIPWLPLGEGFSLVLLARLLFVLYVVLYVVFFLFFSWVAVRCIMIMEAAICLGACAIFFAKGYGM